MQRPLSFLLLVLLGFGCGSNPDVKLLAPHQFTAVTLAGTGWVSTEDLGEVESLLDTNVMAQVGLKSRLIVPGSQVTILVAEDTSLNKQYLIQPGVPIEYPPLGRIEIEGLTPEELAQIIKQGLEKDYFRTATVEVKVDRNLGGGIIYVLGSVWRPGPIALPYNQKFTVLQAIMAAGGVSAFGNEAKIQVIRYGEDGKKYKTIVNLARIKAMAEFENDIPLVGGDWLVVPEKLFNF